MSATLAPLVAPVTLDAMRPIEQVNYSYSANYSSGTEPDHYFQVFGMILCAIVIPADSAYGAANCLLQKSVDGTSWEWCNDTGGTQISIPLTAPSGGIGQSTALNFNNLNGITYLKIIAGSSTSGRLRLDLRRVKG